MNQNDKLKQLKDNYNSMDIPKELELNVKKTILTFERKSKAKAFFSNSLKVAAIAAVLFIGTVNINGNIAYALSDIPVIGDIVRVITFNRFEMEENNFSLKLETPSIEGLENKSLENYLNAKYISDNKALYDSFIKDMEEMKKDGFEDAHMGTESGYTIKTDTPQLLSIERYIFNVVGSSSTVLVYDTIDKNNQILITLPSLFKDTSYIESISNNIKSQMLQQMLDDPDIYYWLNDESLGDENFDKINPDQHFYITSNNELVIVFDKYAVAPGYMGNVEFLIPTSVIQNILVSNEYIK